MSNVADVTKDDYPYSWSQLNTFLRCERQYAYKYVERIPVEFSAGGALIGGDAMHKAIQRSEEDVLYAEAHAGRKGTDLYETFVEFFWARVEEEGGVEEIEWGGRRDFNGKRAEDENWWIGGGGVSMLTRYVRLRRTWADEGVSFYPNGVEMDMTVELPLPHPKGLRVIVDRFLYLEGEEPLIVDWKTGQVGRALRDGGDMQLAVYAYAIKRSSLALDVKRGAFVYLRANERPKLVQFVDLTEAVKLVEPLYAAMQAKIEAEDPVFMLHPSDACGFCNYRPVCPYGQIREAREAPLKVIGEHLDKNVSGEVGAPAKDVLSPDATQPKLEVVK